MTTEIPKVEWYSGHTQYDQPRRLLLQHQWVEVKMVLSRGYTPHGAFIKLLASDQNIYVLDYSLSQDAWRVRCRS